MVSKEKIQSAYIDHVLTQGTIPASVYVFARKHKFAEEDFYKHFGAFEAIDASIWEDFFDKTIAEIELQEIWPSYTSREKALSFYYTFFELLKRHRSLVVFSMNNFKKGLHTPKQLNGSKEIFESFCIKILQEGIESGELNERKFLSDRYKDALWMQLAFLINFWVKDYSKDFEKTDEAIEKGVNLTFDLFQRTAIDNLLDYGKFLAQNAGFKMSF